MPPYGVTAPTEAVAYLLLDRSDSMGPIWREALGGINAYVETLAKTVPHCRVTVAVFDSQNSFEIIRDGLQAGDWKPVTDDDAVPRGMTPLYDAILRLCAHAQQNPVTKTSIVITTDGQENASQEGGKRSSKAALDACRERGWDVIFLGVNWDAMGQASSVGTQSHHTMNYAADSATAVMESVATRSAKYSTGQTTADAAITDADRAKGNFNP